jgi:CubicO group peptidase (beta-lactamase class C family)
MNPSKEQELQIDNYLRNLRECLPNMSVADREEIVREISVHIRDCAQEPNSSIDGILNRLGPPESLASQYGHDLLIRQASRSISPLLILRATLELAKRGLEGFASFLAVLVGYSLGGGLVFTAILKPIFPRQVGLWIGHGVFNLGFHEPRYSDPVHEVLGWWYIPVAVCLGCFFLWLTTSGIRSFLRRSKQRGPLFAQSHMKSIIPIFLFCLLATACSAQNKKDDTPKPAQSITELQQQLEKILKDTHTPGMSVAIVHGDGPEWIAGLGKADVASDRVTTSETLFRIGSTSKAFASLSMLKLANEGKLSLEDPVRKLAPEVWFENRWEASDPVRVVDLLEHTTGWDDMHLREYAEDAPGMGLREALDYDHHSRISRWPPGTRMAYCNSGPAVAAYIVEKIAGQRFEDYVEQNFFAPIGMKTATYFHPTSALSTTLYHPDGKTPYPYWNILYRPAGAINASANDMAAYVLFYLNRGAANGAQIMPAASIARMEAPTRTWAAKEGLKTGYGLSNYWSIRDGFVYHGHNGGVAGGITEMAYLPDYDVGYFYSINAGNGGTFEKIGKAIRAYVTRELQKPPLPPVASLPANAGSYAGWYQPDSPRNEMLHFMDRLAGIGRVRFQDGKLSLNYWAGSNETFLPVAGTLFRHVPKKDLPDPISTLELLSNGEGQFLQPGTLTMDTMKRIPTWLAILEIVLTVLVLLSIAAILVYAPFWLLGGRSKKRRRPAERGMRLWPLVAALSLVAVVVIFMLVSDDPIPLLGNLTGWSAALFFATVAYAVASLASALALWRASKQVVRSRIRTYSMAVTLALLIAAWYFAYWGMIGFRTWA